MRDGEMPGLSAPQNSEEMATLTLPDGRTVSLPFLTDASGAEFVDVRQLYVETSVCCFDPGFSSTASCESEITYIDGVQGHLLYRGPSPPTTTTHTHTYPNPPHPAALEAFDRSLDLE